MNDSARLLRRPEKARLRAEDFLLLNEAGAFAEYRKTELIDGDVYGMNSQHSPHARAKGRLAFALTTCLLAMKSDLEAMIEVSVRLSDHSVPEPDIVLTRWRGAGIVPLDSVALIVEVSDTTLDIDLGRKSDLYAAAGVLEYWVVDVNENRVLMHEHPSVDGYLIQRDVPFGETLMSATIEGLAVESARLRD